jgi:aminoglycoside 3-N-acetyltransferase
MQVAVYSADLYRHDVSEAALIAATSTPRTRTSIAVDLRAAGLQRGDVLVLHSSLKAIGWVSGGPVAVLLAFQDVLTESGTLVVPAHTSNLTDPANWQSPPVPADWVPLIQESVPAFDPARTPSRDMGIIAETFRSWPGVHRSAHPHVSFAAWGRHAHHMTGEHQLAWSMGEGSPLHRAYELNAKTMLLGTRNCTSLHLAEALSGTVATTTSAAAVTQNSQRAWVIFPDWVYSTDQFSEILDAFCTQDSLEHSLIGSAQTLLLDQRRLVDFAVEFLRQRPGARQA